MAYTTIKKPSDHFNTVTTTGGAKSITGVGFQPDWIWSKRRDSTSDHHVNDAVRGASKLIYTNATTAEQTNANFLTSFDSDGFTTGSAYWSSSANIVAWNWKAGTGQGSSNTDGSINTTYTSVNTTAGFSISKYVGTGSNATIGHGLGAVPQVVIARNITDTEQWTTYHAGVDVTAPEDYHLRLNSQDGKIDEASVWNDTAPTSSVFSVGSSGAPNGSGDNHIAYCFAEKQGFSRFGSYAGNGNTDGTFIYTGFKPAFLIVKNVSHNSFGASNWMLYDNKRDPDNQMGDYLYPNNNNAGATNSNGMDFLSNGIKMRNNFGDANYNNETYIYMAFAEEPLVGDNPATAR